MKKIIQTIGDKQLVKRAQLMIFACVISSPLANAQATRTWVSGVGDDANPCSRTAPCKTFAGAISKTAPGGEIDALDPGGFGAVTITKGMTIEGDGTLAAILSSGTNGIIVNAAATDRVSIRNLTINGGTSTLPGLIGIKILAAAEVNIEDCVIFNFGTRGIEIQTSGACRVNLKNTIIRDCSGGALLANPNAVVTLSKCSLLASQFGFRTVGSVTANLDECLISGHTFSGVFSDTSAVAGTASVTLNHCVVSDNGLVGIVSKGASSTVRIGNNTISNNVTGISAQSSGALLSFGNNQFSGNGTDGTSTGTITLK